MMRVLCMSAVPRASPTSSLAASAVEGLVDPAVTAGVGSSKLASQSGRCVAFSHCRVELPFLRFAGRDDNVSLLHRLALRLDVDRPENVHALDRMVATVRHAFNAIRQSVIYQRKYGAYVGRARGIGRWRQLCAGWTCLFRHNQLPRHYYERQLFNEPDAARWLDHIEHRHLTVLLGALNRRLPVHLLTNKLLFAEHCRAHGLPASPTLAAWNGEGRAVIPMGVLPRSDLYAKPLADYGGAGTRLILCDRADQTYDWDGAKLTPGKLGEALARSAPGRGCLLQERLRNSAQLVDLLGQDDIANLRLVTGLYPGGEPQLLAAGLRVPSHFTTHGHDRQVLLAPVSLDEGRLGVAHVRGTCGEGFTVHPDTGALLTGVILPRWADMVRLAGAAHRTCPWLPFVGWDVIDSDHGLLLLEANAYWGANVVQMPGALPLGRTAFPAMFLAWHRHFGLPTLEDSAGPS